jgi:valyl-tRNA synthetase
LHGLVLDGKGQKMSKSLGNFIDPLEVIAKYGADAYRMSLIVGVGPGNESKLGEDKIKAYKNFANKLWNITRFILSAAEGERYGKDAVAKISYDSHFTESIPRDSAEAVHLKVQHDLITEITKEMDEYKFYLVGEKLYHYVWHEFADKIIEESKAVLTGDDETSRTTRVQFLLHSLYTILKILHPFMPFVTEEIWAELSSTPADKKNLLIVEAWPTFQDK